MFPEKRQYVPYVSISSLEQAMFHPGAYKLLLIVLLLYRYRSIYLSIISMAVCTCRFGAGLHSTKAPDDGCHPATQSRLRP